MNIIAIIQARLGSKRYPNKVLEKVNGDTLISILINRLSDSKQLDKVVVATTDSDKDDRLYEEVNNLGYKCYRGDEDNVLKRYFDVAVKEKADAIVRITGDCPLIDPSIVDEVIKKFRDNKFDYISNICPPTFPDGMDVEIFTYQSLEESFLNAKTKDDLEHVTPYIIRNNNFSKYNYKALEDNSDIRLTVDEKIDYDVVKKVINYFHPNNKFSLQDILDHRNQLSQIINLNKSITRNEGSTIGSGQKTYKKAKSLIPGGNMLLSKRPEMFLPEKWPAYYSSAKGCEIVDLDGNKYIDLCIMGIGTNILGYSNDEVDEAVISSIKKSNMSTFNCAEEVELAEKLVELHPWAQMVKFARSGGEANAVAIRIARAASGKEKVAFCGYHGWHDWYLSVNLNDNTEGLDTHLIPGLEPKGVPNNLKNTVFPFSYNNFSELEALVNQHDIGVIKMEVMRNEEPKDNFLQKVRKLADDRSIVLIFDECTSGFRKTFGGLHKFYDVNPDIAMFGKAMGNGFAITSVIGKKDIMESAQSTFISSTFWTERVGPTAGLKTLQIMERDMTWETIDKKGKKIIKYLNHIASLNNLEIQISGLNALINYNISSEFPVLIQTLITQEMLKRGFLANNNIYVSVAHTDEYVDSYIENLNEVFKLISKSNTKKELDSLLESPLRHTGFNRIN